MSRCFPYPPPGYTPARASNEALIESIKFQKEMKKAKDDKQKEKKREKNEKRKLKKDKAKPKAAEYDLYGGKNFENSKDVILKKESKDDTEQLERSSITEEHDPSQNASYSSDSTQNSNKRKRHAFTSDETHAQCASNGLDISRVQGNVLRIRLPSQKNMKCEINKEQLSSPSIRSTERHDRIASRDEQNVTTSGSVATPSTRSHALPPRKLNNELRQPQFPPRAEQNLTCTTSAATPSNSRQAALPGQLRQPQIPISLRDKVAPPSRAEQNVRCSTSLATPSSSIQVAFPRQLNNELRRRQIPLSLQDKVAPPTRAEQNVTCSTSAATPSTSSQTLPLPPRLLNKELLKQSQVPSSSLGDMCTSSHGHRVSKKKQKLSRKYTRVLEKVLPPMQACLSYDDTNCYDDDQDWLGVGPKKQGGGEQMEVDKTDTVDSRQIPFYPSCAPLARYIPDADVYALPYTVPF